jgi:hypothetical protein
MILFALVTSEATIGIKQRKKMMFSMFAQVNPYVLPNASNHLSHLSTR